MLSRGHPCLKRHVLPTVLDTIAAPPEEPLLFLYPRWFTAAVRHRRSISTAQYTPTSTTRLRNAGGFGPGTHRRLSLGGSTRRWASSNNAVRPDVTEDAGSSQQHEASTSTLENGQTEQAESESGRDEFSPHGHTTDDTNPSFPASAEEDKSLGARRKRLFNIFADIQSRPHIYHPPSPPKSGNSAKGRDLKTHTRPLAAAPKGPVQERTRAIMKRLSVRDRRKLRFRMYFNERAEAKSRARWTLWPKIQKLLEEMEQNTTVWKKAGIQYKEMLLPEETVALLAGATDMAMRENIWHVPVHNGCKVHVLHPRESEGQYRKVVLSGSKRVVELVEGRIAKTKSLQENGDPLVDIRKPPIPVFPSMEAMARKNIPAPLIHGVWDRYRGAKDPATLDVLLPQSQNLSSVREFAEQVDELTRSVPSYGAPQGNPHYRRIAKSLVKMFKNDRYHSFLSSAAVNTALSFLLDRDFVGYARTIFLIAEHVVTVDSFNIVLKFAAQRQNMMLYHQFLMTMPRLDIRPNSDTWLTFLECLISPKSKGALVSLMIEKGYLSGSSAIRTALQVTIQETFLAHLESGKSVESFFNMLIDTCGANWFPPSLINQMLSVAATRKDVPTMERLLHICKTQGLAVNSGTVTQIISMFRKDLFSLLRYLFQFIDRPEMKLEKNAWERLFLMAFKGRHYNTCRVLWRYACIYKGVTHKMRQTVLTSLVRNASYRKSGGQYNELWLTSAGKVIVGIDLHLPHYPLDDKLAKFIPSEFNRNPVAYLATFASAGEERKKQQRLASALILRDIDCGPMYRPLRSMGIMLEAAAVLDQEWNWIPRPTQWLVQNAIQVPVGKKSSYVQ
ncbi:uncharacterized protein BDW43DRAFT_287112 [Aspergillus alliaceus]|uniref:uncharacterized protein n=1 Tax=Petromyces alliaceus TaxID=209559 RepID=UPI0012A7639A|nr:uncharacterized protein BDW43DRAFT_287112 [Aspergillus alliaceus]KAB8230011.1 hypothetical protein BDW43DRAFT_287112 [Aspergillus alliaceus]